MEGVLCSFKISQKHNKVGLRSDLIDAIEHIKIVD